MKTKTTKINFATICMGRSLTVVCTGIVLTLAVGARAQNLFVSDMDGNIYKFAPGYVNGDPLTTFASGLGDPSRTLNNSFNA